MEISGVAQLGARTLSSGPVAPLPQPVRVQQVDQNSGTSNAGQQAGDHPNQEAQAAPTRDLLALRRAVAEGDRPAGPPPSFDVSFLELETDLKQKLARMEAARSKERDAEALQSAAEIEAEANLRTTDTEHSEAAPSMGVA
ncbi:hypothetical protein [Maritimibacter dapengensis]|uniref:Uncharacterized protein n=1 Tax=Maritimibacter dapengensis TaxID=2836868 RepID=A0ABS6SYJ8_9RHOB|nr:hypothetical protein [Maritimibacter dapengensis]MBV7378037.1 hypothetical protein [Maritimibacter dapengensis]